MAHKAADIITEILSAIGVRRVYGVVGDSLNGLTESMRRRGDIDWIHTRHEEAAAFAAGAEAHLTGELAVCAGTRLRNPNFAAVAKACGIHGVRVEDPGDPRGRVTDVLAHDGPALLDVVTNTEELAIPPKIEAEQVKGFGLWALQAVMNGRGDQLVDLTLSNFVRR